MLTFTSDNGLYDDIEAYGNGDSGVYPGSGPEKHCKRYGIEIREVNSYGNMLGFSGTAGNGTCTARPNFYNNSAGISDDSFASGHPGMPQDCSKWDDNEVYSNNVELLHEGQRGVLRHTPFEKRPRERVCPQFQVPVGSGFILYGVNDNLIADNEITDNWRSGIRLFWVPAAIRGENDPGSSRHVQRQQVRRAPGLRPDGTRPRTASTSLGRAGRPQLLAGQHGPAARITSDPARCRVPGSMVQLPVNPVKAARSRARPGTPRRTGSPSAARGSPRRRSRRDEGVAGGDRSCSLAGVGGLLLLGDRDGGATQAATDTARLQWKEKPDLILVPELPRDRILTGQLRNASLRAVDLDTERVQILDAKGHPLKATALFAQSFSHGLYPWSMNVKGSKFERRRIGKIATIKPGQAVPLTLSWRVPQGGSEPVEVRFDGGTLSLPR